MDTVEFALFKYKYIEGILKGWRASEFDTSRYKCGTVEAYIKYDIKNDTAKLYIFDILMAECKIKELPRILKEQKLYEEK